MPFDTVNASIAAYKPLIAEVMSTCCEAAPSTPEKLKPKQLFAPPPPQIKQEEESEDDIADVVHDAVPVVAGVFVLGLTTGLCVAYFLKRN